MSEVVVFYVMNKLDRLLMETTHVRWWEYGYRASELTSALGYLGFSLKSALGVLGKAKLRVKQEEGVLRTLVQDLTNVVYRAEEVIDYCLLSIRNPAPSRILRYLRIFNSSDSYKNLPSKIRQLKDQISSISNAISQLENVDISEDGDQGAGTSYIVQYLYEREYKPFRDDTDVVDFEVDCPSSHDDISIVGREEEKELVIQQLLNNEKRRCIISIVGMGGLGKTTFARKIYHSSEVKKSFKACVWVSVPKDQTNSSAKLLKRIIRGLIGIKEKDDLEDDSDEEEELRVELQELLKKLGRYLIIMDDICSMNMWNEIEPALPDVRNGSRVLLTTRSEDVAKSADPSTAPHEMRFLDKTESEELLLKKYDLASRVQDWEAVGGEFVDLCGGLPLSLVILGGWLLDPLCDWSSVLNSLKQGSTEAARQCLHILSLSYQDMPHDLKLCFLLIGSFPLGREISIKQLKRLWIEGYFIHDRHQARMVLEKLIERCMVEVAGRSYNGKVSKIKIHGLLHEFCIAAARDTGLLIANSCHENTSSMTTQCLALHSHIDDSWIDKHHGNLKCQLLQALLGFNLTVECMIGKYINGLKFLRVIDLEGSFGLRVLPQEITSMFLLVYLRIVDSVQVVLPSSIRNLQHLQILDVRNGARLEDGSLSSEKIFGFLKSLQLLRCITAGTWIGTDLGELTNIEMLGIQNIRGSHKGALLKSVEKLINLASLTLRSPESIPAEILTAFPDQRKLRSVFLDGQLSPKQLPRAYEFPPNLAKLTLKYTRLELDPNSTLEDLPNLVYLKLWTEAYVGKLMYCSRNGFPKLQCMIVDDLANLEYWTIEAGAMPCLTHLTANRCPALKMLPVGLHHLKNLQELQMLYMSQKLKESIQEDKGADWYKKIQHVPSIIINDF